uniref:Uncharacterized protein n=1 Tax=Brassica campestris TaxID=3711 RepID=A0A3P6CE43_BRACM|nr:unnamed protein product [Brassica rapa]
MFRISHQAVDALYDCKSEVIGPGSFRFKGEIDCAKQFREAAKRGDDPGMLNVMSNYGMQCMHQVLLAYLSLFYAPR